jgi:hypothetical protein
VLLKYLKFEAIQNRVTQDPTFAMRSAAFLLQFHCLGKSTCAVLRGTVAVMMQHLHLFSHHSSLAILLSLASRELQEFRLSQWFDQC